MLYRNSEDFKSEQFDGLCNLSQDHLTFIENKRKKNKQNKTKFGLDHRLCV